jgi:alpha-galactosidase
MINLERIHVLDCDKTRGGRVNLGPVSELAYLQHGWQSWSPVRVRELNAPDDAFEGDDYDSKHLPHGRLQPGQAQSEWFTVLGRVATERGALIGFISAADQLSEIRFATAGEEITSLRATCYADGIQLAPGGTLRSEVLCLKFGEPRALVEEYAARLGETMQARRDLEALSGWCTWYFYFGQNTSSDVEANVERIRIEHLPLDLQLIDDGYQTAIGDWTSINPDKFPQGMRAAADGIRGAGMRPGIWLAPFGTRHDSQLAAEHPEFLLRDEAGGPVLAWTHWFEPVYALDLTHPGVLQHLRDLFGTICFDWGFDFVKLDFIFAGALPGIHYDRRATRAQSFRRGLQTIRDTLGEDKVILGCGAPQAASVGLVDAMRIGQDVAISWKPTNSDPSAPSTFQALGNILLRAPFHKRLWVNDPDCVIVRKRGNLNLMTHNENRTLATMAALTGGFVLDSDNLPDVPAKYLDDLRCILPPNGELAVVRDYWGSRDQPPSRLELQQNCAWGEWWILTATNWGSRSRNTTVELPRAGAYHVYDFWRKKYLGAHRERLTLMQSPHETSLLVVTPVTQDPGLIASTFHVSSGGAEVKSLESQPRGLRVELEKKGRQSGELVFVIPAEWDTVRVKFDGHRATKRQLAAGVISVKLTLDERAVVEMEG